MNKEDQMKQRAKEISSRISNISFELRRKKEATEANLQTLKNELANALVDHALGEVSREEVIKIKNQIAEAEEFLRDYPFIEQGLEWRAGRQSAVIRKAERLQEYRRKYEELKSELLKSGYDPSSIESLQNLAIELDEKEDCSRFVAKLK